MKINMTEEQKRKLIVSEIDKNMFVEAGAGAGKSTLIVSRIIHQLKSGILPSEIVAITFTNAATHELKKRIVEAARKELKNAGMTQEQKSNMQNAILSIDQMQISTIHSFCNRILKERSLDAEMPMGVTLIDEAEVAKLRDESFTIWAEGLKKKDWERLLRAEKYRSGALEVLKNMTNQLLNISDDLSVEYSLPPKDEQEFEAVAVPFVNALSDEIVKRVNKVYLASYTSVEDIPDSYYIRKGRAVRDAIINKEYRTVIKEVLTPYTTKSFLVMAPGLKFYIDRMPDGMTDASGRVLTYAAKNALAKNYQALSNSELNKIEQLVKSKEKELSLLLGSYENYLYAPYIEYALEARTYFKNRLGADILTNNLMIQKTHDLLNASLESRKFFSEKFKCIYVDEFQDTDHVQDAFIRMLAESFEEEGKLRDGALFVVGDPKQSIYRFRGAEPEVYFSTKEYFESLENAYVIELQDNYRSNNHIIEWVNNQFSNKDITHNYAYVPMNKVKVIPENQVDDKMLYGVYMDFSPLDYIEGASVGQDVEKVTNLILNLVNGDHYIFDYDKDRNLIKREIRYSDFLLLSMYTVGMNNYAETFRMHGIPFVMDSKIYMQDEWYLQVFYRLFCYLGSPYDFIITESAKEGLRSFQLPYDYIEKLLKKMRVETETMSALGKLKYLQNNWKLFLFVDMEFDSSELLQIQTRITQMVENILQAYAGSVQGIKNGMEDYLAGQVEHELILDEGTDAVRFMNLHKAKGLEGKIVIWLNRNDYADYKDGAYRCDGKYYPEIKKEINGYNTFIWGGYNRDELLIDAAKRSDAAEKIRLEYVAATRAEQVLIFMDRINKKNTLFSADYDFGTRSIRDIIYEKQNYPAKSLVQTEKYGKTSLSDVAAEELKNPLYKSESPSDFEDESAGKEDRQSGMQHALRRPSGAVFGTVMHRAFELLVNRISYKEDFLNEYVQKDANSLIKACYIQAISESSDQISLADMDEYKLFLSEAIMAYGKWWYANQMPDLIEEFYTELPFSYFVDGESEESDNPLVWRHGFADLVLKMKSGRFMIIDYKSDSDLAYPDEKAFENRLIGKYSAQIEAYKDAIETAFLVSRDMIDAKLISFSQKNLTGGENLRVRVTDIK